MDNLGRLRWGVLALLVVLAAASAAWALARNGDFEGAALNLGTELAGAVVTYALFELVIERRERHKSEKDALIRRMRSTRADVAVQAIEELRHRGWLYDGQLRDVDLEGFTLRSLDDSKWGQFFLSGVALPGANLKRAGLAGAELADCDLRGANLNGAHLEGSYLVGADLKGAHLGDAHLEEALMDGVNLRRARLSPNRLAQAKSLAGTTLPDGTKLSEDNWKAEFEEWREKLSASLCCE